MSYESARNSEIHDAHQRLIELFARTCRAGQPTVVLLPGGMGSHLDRSTEPYRNDGSNRSGAMTRSGWIWRFFSGVTRN